MNIAQFLSFAHLTGTEPHRASGVTIKPVTRLVGKNCPPAHNVQITNLNPDVQDETHTQLNKGTITLLIIAVWLLVVYRLKSQVLASKHGGMRVTRTSSAPSSPIEPCSRSYLESKPTMDSVMPDARIHIRIRIRIAESSLPGYWSTKPRGPRE